MVSNHVRYISASRAEFQVHLPIVVMVCNRCGLNLRLYLNRLFEDGFHPDDRVCCRRLFARVYPLLAIFRMSQEHSGLEVGRIF